MRIQIWIQEQQNWKLFQINLISSFSKLLRSSGGIIYDILSTSIIFSCQNPTFCDIKVWTGSGSAQIWVSRIRIRTEIKSWIRILTNLVPRNPYPSWGKKLDPDPHWFGSLDPHWGKTESGSSLKEMSATLLPTEYLRRRHVPGRRGRGAPPCTARRSSGVAGSSDTLPPEMKITMNKNPQRWESQRIKIHWLDYRFSIDF
jgi:hypothetical protein